jgi:hypothetical protein
MCELKSVINLLEGGVTLHSELDLAVVLHQSLELRSWDLKIGSRCIQASSGALPSEERCSAKIT